LADVLTLDGSHGEGGGQILRTALSLSVVTQRAFRLANIRMGRRNPGLMPQHLSAVRAAAAISDAMVSGDQLSSSELDFSPRHAGRPASYAIDVADIAGQGSAGSTSLILQTILIPLTLADGPSSLVIRGGTHVEWSPPFDDLLNGYFPALRRIGLHVDGSLKRWGWYPAGQGEIVCNIPGRAQPDQGRSPCPIAWLDRGALRRITGRAVAANLPAHIPQRIADRARACLADLGVPLHIEPQRVTAACPGAGIFLTADYQDMAATFSGHGRLGKTSETVAEEAVAALTEHHAAGAAVELHLADQLLLPLALASGPSVFTVARPTGHLLTNAWTIGQFGIADISIGQGTPCRVQITPRIREPSNGP
jgi:RNA 3'-terminal phosphate cyclase (ATP)